jgi:hypothetical protein
MDLPLDFRELLEEFARERVEHLIVGGYAFAFHARPRATKDLDLLLRGDAENLDRAATALLRFGAPENVVVATRSMQDSEVVYFGQPPLRIDLLRTIDGVDVPSVFARAVAGQWGDLSIRVIGLDDLIANKRAAGRAQDLADVKVLERIRAQGKP